VQDRGAERAGACSSPVAVRCIPALWQAEARPTRRRSPPLPVEKVEWRQHRSETDPIQIHCKRTISHHEATRPCEIRQLHDLDGLMDRLVSSARGPDCGRDPEQLNSRISDAETAHAVHRGFCGNCSTLEALDRDGSGSAGVGRVAAPDLLEPWG